MAQDTPEAPVPRRPRPAVVAGVLLVVALILGAVVFDYVRSNSEPIPPAPKPTPGLSPTTDRRAVPPTRPGIEVYWTGHLDDGPVVLYRETRTVRDRGTGLRSAVAAMMEQIPLDPRHRTSWRGPSHLFTRVADGGIAVDVSADAFTTPGLGPADAAAAIQQLVWTATEAVGKDLPVTVLVDGRTGFRAWGWTPLPRTIRRDPAFLAPLWLLSPTQGQLLPAGRPIQVRAEGRAPEGTVGYDVVEHRADGTDPVVKQAFVPGPGGRRAPFAFTLPALPAGDYTLRLFLPDEGDPGVPSDPDAHDVKLG